MTAEENIEKLREACQASVNLFRIVRRLIDNPGLADSIPERLRIVIIEKMEDAENKIEEALRETEASGNATRQQA